MTWLFKLRITKQIFWVKYYKFSLYTQCLILNQYVCFYDLVLFKPEAGTTQLQRNCKYLRCHEETEFLDKKADSKTTNLNNLKTNTEVTYITTTSLFKS